MLNHSVKVNKTRQVSEKTTTTTAAVVKEKKNRVINSPSSWRSR